MVIPYKTTARLPEFSIDRDRITLIENEYTNIHIMDIAMNTLITHAPILKAFDASALPNFKQFKSLQRVLNVRKKLIRKLNESVFGSYRFAVNKMHFGIQSHNIGKEPQLINQAGALPYFTGVDEIGVYRGGHLPWLYLDDMYADKAISEAEKYQNYKNTLAHLPGNVSFRFILNPAQQKFDTIKKAFLDCGFIHVVQKTFIYTPANDGRDVAAQLKSDARSKINAAKRDLELVHMSVEEYFEFYRENLAAAGKESWFNLDIDYQLVKAALDKDLGQAQIIATRRKASEDSTGQLPIEAAIVLTCGADGYIKLLRITYRREGGKNAGFTLHKHAVKFLIFEAMNRAADAGLKLDTDCFTPGAEALYTRFGVFEMVDRNEFRRKSMQWVFRMVIKKANIYYAKIERYALSRLSCLIYQLLFTHYIFQTVQSSAL